jgi:subtilisin family serine protease
MDDTERKRERGPGRLTRLATRPHSRAAVAPVMHASGSQVDSFVPGGSRLKLSGTSMAAPNVVNLAAKLFAHEPSLTPGKVIDLIRRGASASDDGRRHLIDETRSVLLLKAGAP